MSHCLSYHECACYMGTQALHPCLMCYHAARDMMATNAAGTMTLAVMLLFRSRWASETHSCWRTTSPCCWGPSPPLMAVGIASLYPAHGLIGPKHCVFQYVQQPQVQLYRLQNIS